MGEGFSEISNASIQVLAKQIVTIAEVLKKELPFDSLTASWHVEEGTEEVTIGILARWQECHHSVMIHTHYLDEPPEPKEMYPAACCAVGKLQVFSSEAFPREVLEVCGTAEGWLVHHNGKWISLSASYVAFLMGISYKLPDV